MATPIRGQTRPLPVKAEIIPAVIPPEVLTLNANLNASIHNRFDVEVINAKTGKVCQRAHGENVICAALWANLFTPTAYFNYIHYGTGSGTPAATDTSLFTFLGYGTPSDNVYSIDPSSKVYSIRRKIQLSETTAVGSTISEVGIGYGTTAATLCTHAMLKDANGNQISIAKTSTDIVNIYATVFVNYASYDNGYIKMLCTSKYDDAMNYLCGMASNFAVTAALSNDYQKGYSQNYLGKVYTVPGQTITYNSASKSIVVACARIAAASGNSGGYLSFALLANYKYYNGDYAKEPFVYGKIGGTWFAGCDITGETIGTGDGSKKDFATAFPLINAATVYVDGVAASPTVDNNMPLANTDMGRYFELLPEYSSSGVGETMPLRLGDSSFAFTPIESYATFYNPFYAKGINSFYDSSFTGNVFISEDAITWTNILACDASGTYSIPSDYVNSKYWRFTNTGPYDWGWGAIGTFTSNGITATNIHFATAPASGAVITADYHTPVIAKDTNHVFDLSVTIQLGEYTG